MTITHPVSLAATLDAANEAFFYEIPVSTRIRDEIIALLTHRQVQTGVNAGFFLPFTAETEIKPRLFSGEELHTAFAATHILLIEATRMIKLLAPDDFALPRALQNADRRMEKMCYSKFCPKGECKTLSIAYLRYLATGKSSDITNRINTLLTNLPEFRDGKGKWSGFPFFYTLLTLIELDEPQASQELQYSLPVCKKYQAQSWPVDPFSKRRREIIARALARS